MTSSAIEFYCDRMLICRGVIDDELRIAKREAIAQAVLVFVSLEIMGILCDIFDKIIAACNMNLYYFVL